MNIEELDKVLPTSLSRRRLLGLGLVAGPLAIVASACGGDDGQALSSRSLTSTTKRSVSATPACGDDDETPSLTEGPFFESGSPERTNIHDGDGTALVVTGVVMDTSCQTLAGAKLDFWQANNDGDYDNSGFAFRGHQFTDEMGRYRLETIVPPPYGPRTAHIHVKVQPEGGDILTTQLFFPDEPKNSSDDIYTPECLMEVSDVSDGKAATFDFAVEA